MPATVADEEPTQVVSRNGSANINKNTSDQSNDTNHMEAGDKTEAKEPMVPDGGWGWMVVFGSFMIHVIADGIAYSFGIFVEDFGDYFECSKGQLGGLGSLLLGVTWGSGNHFLTS